MSVTSNVLLPQCFLLLCYVTGTMELKITEFEVPHLITVGRDAKLDCNYELGEYDQKQSIVVKWFWTPVSSTKNDKTMIYQRIAGRPAIKSQRRYSGAIDVKKNDTIVLKNMQPQFSGEFECVVSSFTDDVRKQTHLTVFSEGTGPIVNVTEIQDTTRLSEKKKLYKIVCRAVDVTPKPNLIVNINGHFIDKPTIIEDYDNNGLYEATTIIVLSVESIDKGDNEVSCEMTFSDSNFAGRPTLVDVKPFAVS